MGNPTPAVHVAYTAPINPSGASPQLTLDQVWAALQEKVKFAEKFVGGAIESTDVLSTTTNDLGRKVTTREVVFREGGKRIKEVVTEIPKVKLEFTQPCGGLVSNVVSEGPEGAEKGDLWMTYIFEYILPDASEEDIKGETVKRKNMAQTAVESTIKVIRKMVQDGEIK